MALVAVTSLVEASASAAPLKIRNGSAVRVALAGKREPGVGLRFSAGGWRLDLAAMPTATADIFDVTEGSTHAKWTTDIVDGALFLDQETFIPGHAYRVIIRRGAESLGTTLIYLYPPATAKRQRVTFDDADTLPNTGDTIAITKKPTL
jgi:hypothetical protein